MKVLLNIGGSAFIAKDAATAAKVADLLGGMEPAAREWLSTGPVLVAGHGRHEGDVSISALGSVKPMERKAFEVKKAAERAEAEAQAKRTGEPNAKLLEGGAK